MNLVSVSKFLSLVLRHDPGAIGIELDAHGWVDCDLLIAASTRHGQPLDRSLLDEIVRISDKQRFALARMAGASAPTRDTPSPWIWRSPRRLLPACSTTAPWIAF